MSISKKVSRGVKISSGLVVLGIIAGAYLGRWLPEFNGGGGVLPGNAETTSTETPPAEDRPPTEPAAEAIEPGEVLELTIKGRNYFVAEPGREELREISLQQAVELAAAVPGNEDGVRVRVTRDGTARAKTEDDLKKALLEAQLPPEAIDGLGHVPP